MKVVAVDGSYCLRRNISRSQHNLGEGIYRLVGCSCILVPCLYRTRKFLNCGRRSQGRCRPRCAIIVKSKTPLKIPFPRLLNLIIMRNILLRHDDLVVAHQEEYEHEIGAHHRNTHPPSNRAHFIERCV